MKKPLIKILPLLLGGILFAQNKQDSIQFKRISDEILINEQAYSNLYDLTKNIGHRLSGSESYEKATKWAFDKLKEAGADKVWYQEVMVPVWVRGKESLQIKTAKGQWKKLNMLSLGNSEGTKGQDLTAEIILVKSFDEFNKLSEADVKGKIVFFNYPFNQTFISTGQAYGDAGKYRSTTASLVAKKGGKAVIIRSLSSSFDDVPHTGMMRYQEGIEKIPAVAIGPKSADELEKTLKSEKILAKLNSNCTMKPDKLSHSVIGEITGKKDQSVIVVGGHLDSWDVGEGASDDGTGIVQSIEILRTFKKLNLQNNHTIRVVCFANEENGVKGGKKYKEEAQKNNEKHLFAIESDGGGFTPRGFGLDMKEGKRRQIQSWASLFFPYGIYDFTKTYSGTDVEPLNELDVPTAELVPDSQRYFDIHHTAEDTFEKVNRREMLLGAVAMGQLIYMIDKNW
ncbi:M20/M25/M40 family metallo-hydrolase [Epilithonimonas hispanica]|uniref:Carboxypeptidase Q n=1 Tax=Epilithonimonas hispanica TaxID=358687 RepID=A0A3D9D0K8_9FLAO|nr:M20/M25/M40 family metallo-hydrolase [Epilithonimonas hispanica]REC71542.1 peptidase M28 [Epilithonimonas hispanica]